MKLYLSVTLVVVAGFIHLTAAGLKCDSGCAACWKDNDSNGVDIKFSCEERTCGGVCPEGYHGLHCAKSSRCGCYRGDCGDFGPCLCGEASVGPAGYKTCKIPPGLPVGTHLPRPGGC